MSSESKVRLYNRILSTRDEMSEDDVRELSGQIGHRVTGMEEYRTELRIGLYAAFGNEVRTERLFVEGDRHRKEIYFPARDEERGGIAYFRVTNLEELLPGETGFRAPTARQSRLRDINTLGALIVPGVAFDLSGRRMGFGKGFYEANLRAFSGRRIALAYEFQVVPTLPAGPFEKLIDYVVTERRVISCGR
ncbi:MAG: 5-formyltetrahydrofolate cyclo-ligase [Proteobacteria bacterium]|nr:5-formyltetrahydrofolate cyclo-ligase [Pseudomonadota bacterium]